MTNLTSAQTSKVCFTRVTAENAVECLVCSLLVVTSECAVEWPAFPVTYMTAESPVECPACSFTARRKCAGMCRDLAGRSDRRSLLCPVLLSCQDKTAVSGAGLNLSRPPVASGAKTTEQWELVAGGRQTLAILAELTSSYRETLPTAPPKSALANIIGNIYTTHVDMTWSNSWQSAPPSSPVTINSIAWRNRSTGGWSTNSPILAYLTKILHAGNSTFKCMRIAAPIKKKLPKIFYNK